MPLFSVYTSPVLPFFLSFFLFFPEGFVSSHSESCQPYRYYTCTLMPQLSCVYAKIKLKLHGCFHTFRFPPGVSDINAHKLWLIAQASVLSGQDLKRMKFTFFCGFFFAQNIWSMSTHTTKKSDTVWGLLWKQTILMSVSYKVREDTEIFLSKIRD